MDPVSQLLPISCSQEDIYSSSRPRLLREASYEFQLMFLFKLDARLLVATGHSIVQKSSYGQVQRALWFKFFVVTLNLIYRVSIFLFKVIMIMSSSPLPSNFFTAYYPQRAKQLADVETTKRQMGNASSKKFF